MMDLGTYVVFRMVMPKDEAVRGVSPGLEAECWMVMGRKKITRVKGWTSIKYRPLKNNYSGGRYYRTYNSVISPYNYRAV